MNNVNGYVVVFGTFTAKLNFVGPFQTEDAAYAWVGNTETVFDGTDYWVVPLQNKEQFE